jgi:YVTN family beta-propeller protein
MRRESYSRTAWALASIAVLLTIAAPGGLIAQGTPTVTTIAVPSGPWGIAIDSKRGLAFATAHDINELSVIDLTTNAVQRVIPTGLNPHSVAVDESSGRVYVSNVGGDSITVLGTDATTVITSVAVAGAPVGVDVDTLRSRALVVHGATLMTVITTTDTNAAVGIATLSTGSNGSNGYVAVNALTNRAYVTKNEGQTPNAQARVAVIDLSSGAIITDVTTAGFFDDITVNTKTNRVYTANNGASAITVIDGATNAILTNIQVPGKPTDIAVNADKNCIYSANAISNSVTIINGATNAVLDTIAVGLGPKAIAVDQQTGLVYVANRGNNTVSVIRDTRCALAPVTPTPTSATLRLRLPLIRNGDLTEQAPNDNSATAQFIPSGQRIVGVLEDSYDVYTFDAQAGAISLQLSQIPPGLDRRVQLSLYFTSNWSNPDSLKLFDTNAPWQGSITGAAGRYFVVIYTDPQYHAQRAPYSINVLYP